MKILFTGLFLLINCNEGVLCTYDIYQGGKKINRKTEIINSKLCSDHSIDYNLYMKVIKKGGDQPPIKNKRKTKWK